MYTLYDMKFRRRFSVNPYKTLKMRLGEISFYKDWVNTSRGDPYPILCREGNLVEKTGDGRFAVRNNSDSPARTARLIGGHFPYASYELTVGSAESASVGFMISAGTDGRSSYTPDNAPSLRVFLVRDTDLNVVHIAHELIVGGISRGVVTEKNAELYTPGMSLVLTCRGRFFDVYIRDDKKPIPKLTIDVPEFSDIIKHDTFVTSTAALWYSAEAGGSLTVDDVSVYLDAGISHADMKPIRYENGMPMMTDGRLFLTMSSRAEAGGFQSVISWNPSTCEFKMEGALFFDCGDDCWCADVASSVLYDRNSKTWFVWATAFSHGHVLCHGTSIADLRYGINVIDASLMPTERKFAAGEPISLSDDTLWYAKCGDEDPDFVYDGDSGRWYMTVCRCVTENGRNMYRYFLFESDEPFSGYRFVDKTLTGENTGGLITKIGGRHYFVCGSNFDKRACYHVYDLHDLSKVSYLDCDYDDGGFRGWGTIIPVPCGNRTRYVWMTFDRHCGSDYNWSYGNIYVYESDLMNPGFEIGERWGTF